MSGLTQTHKHIQAHTHSHTQRVIEYVDARSVSPTHTHCKVRGECQAAIPPAVEGGGHVMRAQG